VLNACLSLPQQLLRWVISPHKEVFHQPPSINCLLLIVTINLTLEIARGGSPVLISVPSLSMRVFLRFGLERLRIVLYRLLPLLLHPV
jgi:hypothetical protein